jgi:formyl-CoA transferase
MIQPVPGDDFSLVALPLSFDGARPKIVQAPPAIGEHDKSFAAGERWRTR